MLMIVEELILLIVLYSIFMVASLCDVAIYVKKSHRISIMTLCKLMYIVGFAVIPIITYAVYLNGYRASTLLYDGYMWTHFIIFICTVVAYCTMKFGYKIKQRKPKKKSNQDYVKMIMLMTLLLIISVISLSFWASGFGGINELITNANSIRAGFIKSSSNKAFFKHFVPMSMIVSFIAFNYLFIDKNYKRKISTIYVFFTFIVSIFISIIFILANDGRMLAGVYIILFCLLLIKNEYEVKNKNLKSISFKILILSILAIIIIINADSIFGVIKGNTVVTSTSVEERNIFSSLAYEFSFTLTGIQQAIITYVNGTSKLTIINDVINGVFAWLPTSFKPFICVDVWDYNTALMNTGVYGQSPTSILAQSIYDLGFLGVLLIPCIYGFVIRKIENKLESYGSNIFYNTIYIVLGFYLAKGIVYFSMYNIMMNIFFIVAACIIYKVLHKIGMKSV